MFFCFLFVLVAAGAIGFFLNDLAERANQDAAKTSRLLVTTAIGVIEKDLVGRMVDYSWWNDMNDQVTGNLDPDWADDNIGSYLQETFSYSGTYVLSADGEVIFASLGTDPLPDSPIELLGEASDVFLASLQETLMDESVPRSTAAVYNDKIYLLAAAAVTPEDPTEEQLTFHVRPTLFFVRELDDAMMSDIAENYGVGNPVIVLGQSSTGVPLTNAAGTVLASVVWDQARPGDAILVDLIPKLAIVSAMLLIAALTIYFFWIRAALSASEAKSQLLAKMSHELRTPLNPILGFSQMMIGETVGPIAPIYKGYAKDIHRSASHLRNIIEGLLDFSKIEAGKVVLREDVLDLDGLIESVIQIVTPVVQTDPSSPAGETPEIRHEVAEDVPKIRGDELRIRQVLINMLSNAIKFSDGKPVTIRAFKHGNSAQITVEDNGIGISKLDQRKLFEPFVQASPKNGTIATPGTGLGLVISRELMRLHGGSLDLKSVLGEGTTVTLTFPNNRTLNG
ncbi:ATP-binding protein [Hwanghaeella grinnelliae]|uniref:sensor histidine kinase n=1 Tax=Hwanghaeella grinnelliae TaxID=2500179 RepID=UPI000FD91E38|nr:ATP-binding protein [Hwanghaeella grinnelliae]